MPSSMNWADGAAGGTPVSAANLNKLAVVADIGTAGTPTGDAVRATSLPKWTPNTAYTAGEPVVNPSGQTVTANATHTSGASYTAGNWTIVSGGGGTVTDATTGAKGVVQLAGDLGGTAASPTVPRLTVLAERDPASYGTVDLTGATGSAAAIQALFDSGQKKAQLRGGTYLIDAPIFLDTDTSSIDGPYIIEGTGGTTIKLKGSALPTVSTHTADAAVWGFHLNQKRSFLSGGVVTYVADATHRATGGGFPTHPGLVFRNCAIDSDTALAGLAYGNTAAIRFENCTFHTLKYGLSWTGYTDGSSASQCETFGMASGGWLVFQTTNGDGISIDGIKAASGNGIWSAQGCHGGSVSNTIQGGFSFTNCAGINVDNSHSELGGSGNALAQFITVNCSQIVIDHAFNYASATAGQYFLYVNDSASDATVASDVTLRNFRPVYFFGSDAVRSPDIYINATNAPFRLRVDNVTAATIRSGRTEFSPDGIVVGSAITGIVTAITNARGLVAAGHWTLRQTNGNWEIIQPSPSAGLLVSRTLQQPTFATVVATTTSVTGTLTNGTNYEYAMACRDYAGNYSQVSAASGLLAASSSGVITWQAGVPTSPCTLVVWRKASGAAGDVLNTPDAYVEIPLDAARTKVFDTGVRCNGRVWVTTSVPVPNTVAATNHTADGLLFADGTFISKTSLASSGAASTSPRIASNLSTVSVVNTITETDLARLTIPAGQPAANDRYVLVAYGDLLNNSGATVNYVYKAYLGGTALATTASIGMSTQGVRRTWELRIELDIASTTAQIYKARLDGFGTPAGLNWNPVSTSGLFLGTGTATADTSTSKDLALTVTMGTANASADARCLAAYLQRIAA